jgi:hypothetical protein
MGCARVVEDVAEVGGDIAAAATGNAELIPLINAGVSTAGGVAQGESIGKAAGQGAIAGGEALAGQELAGAVGIGSGNDAFNSALGITGDNPAGTGLPDIGGSLNSAIGATGGTSAPTDTNAAGATVNTATGQTLAPSTLPSTTAPSSGAVTSAGSVGDIGSSQINANLSDLSSTAAGAGTSGSPDLGSVTGGQSLAPSTLPSTGGASADSALQSAGTDSIGALQNTPAPANLPSTAGSGFGAENASAGGGLSDWLPKKSTIGTAALGALPLAYEAIKGPAELPGSATQLEAGGAATAPLLALENQGATEAQTGQLTAAQQATITQSVQQQQNALLQELASQGVTNPTQDSRYIAGMQQIQQNAAAQQQAYITAAISEATSAGGAASTNIATAANEQITNDADFQQALAAAFGALGGSIGGVNVKV